MEKLKTCPTCGKIPILKETIYVGQSWKRTLIVQCNETKITFSNNRSVEEAIEHWNEYIKQEV